MEFSTAVAAAAPEVSDIVAAKMSNIDEKNILHMVRRIAVRLLRMFARHAQWLLSTIKVRQHTIWHALGGLSDRLLDVQYFVEGAGGIAWR